MKRVRVIVFAKAPVAGRVKTRLVPALGEAGAARLASRMLERTLAEAIASRVGPLELCGDPTPDHPDWSGLVPPEVHLTSQGEGDLGERMARAALRSLREGERPLIIGTDCPSLDRVALRRAARALGSHDVYLQPAEDGGYVLIALRRFDLSLFRGMEWSGPEVARTTIERVERLGWSLEVGPVLRDVDEPADLALVHPLLAPLLADGPGRYRPER